MLPSIAVTTHAYLGNGLYREAKQCSTCLRRLCCVTPFHYDFFSFLILWVCVCVQMNEWSRGSGYSWESLAGICYFWCAQGPAVDSHLSEAPSSPVPAPACEHLLPGGQLKASCLFCCCSYLCSSRIVCWKWEDPTVASLRNGDLLAHIAKPWTVQDGLDPRVGWIQISKCQQAVPSVFSAALCLWVQLLSITDGLCPQGGNMDFCNSFGEHRTFILQFWCWNLWVKLSLHPIPECLASGSGSTLKYSFLLTHTLGAAGGGLCTWIPATHMGLSS